MCFLFVCMKGWKYISFKHVEQKTNKEMIHYSLPTIANAIAWWVNGLADRYVIIFFLGISANGVYSVASKIPSILNIFQNIFSNSHGKISHTFYQTYYRNKNLLTFYIF